MEFPWVHIIIIMFHLKYSFFSVTLRERERERGGAMNLFYGFRNITNIFIALLIIYYFRIKCISVILKEYYTLVLSGRLKN